MARATGPEMKLFDPTHRRAMSQGQRLALGQLQGNVGKDHGLAIAR
jgi:hypothetical protein